MKRWTCSILLIVILSLNGFSQSAISLNLNTLGFHFNANKQDVRMYENKLTSDGFCVGEPGYEIRLQKFIYLTRWSLEIRQGFHSDAAAKQAGHFALGLRWKFFHYGKHSFSTSLSGVYAFRKTWESIPYYQKNNIYNNGKVYQSKFLLGTDLTYNYYIGKRHDISLSAIYNNSYRTIALAIGYRYWINPYVNIKQCNTCGKSYRKGRFKRWWRSIWR